jgi:hypothetical protein
VAEFEWNRLWRESDAATEAVVALQADILAMEDDWAPDQPAGTPAKFPDPAPPLRALLTQLQQTADNLVGQRDSQGLTVYLLRNKAGALAPPFASSHTGGWPA